MSVLSLILIIHINYGKGIDYNYPKFYAFTNIYEYLNLQNLDVNGKVNILTNALTNCKLRSQTISKRAKRPKQICYFIEDMKNARIRDQYKKRNNLTLYRYWRNRVRYLIQSSEDNYYAGAIHRFKGNTSKMWLITKEVAGKTS